MKNVLNKKQIQEQFGISSAGLNGHIKRHPEVFIEVGKDNNTKLYDKRNVVTHMKAWRKSVNAKRSNKKPAVSSKPKKRVSKTTKVYLDENFFMFGENYLIAFNFDESTYFTMSPDDIWSWVFEIEEFTFNFENGQSTFVIKNASNESRDAFEKKLIDWILTR